MTVPLPPLPPAADDVYRPGGRSVADLVDREHRALLGLAGQVTDPELPAGRRREVLDVLTAVLSRHLSAEEQYLFPAVRAAVPERAGPVDRELEADAGLRTALRGLSGPDDPARPDLADLADLADRVRGHVGRVAALVTALRAVASDAELIRLGNRWEIAEEAAPTRPHPATPATPPWNKIVEPAVGVLDKVRDAVTGRPTQLADLERPGEG